MTYVKVAIIYSQGCNDICQGHNDMCQGCNDIGNKVVMIYMSRLQ